MRDIEPTITRSTHFLRTEASQVEALRKHTSSAVGDAIGRRAGLGPAIRALTPQSHFAGTALTVRCGPGDNLAALVALASVKPGDAIVIACGRATLGAIVGGSYARWALKAGAIAIVTDGLLRDADELDSLGLPIFAAGFSPNGPYKCGPGEIGLPVSIEGVSIESGDVVLGDRDGVVVVPRMQAAAAVDMAETVRRSEAESVAAFGRGETPGWLAALTASARVKDIGEIR